MATPDDTYTHGHSDSVMRSHQWRTAENSASYLLPLLRPGQRLLDVGCGPGTVTIDLAKRVAPGHVVGLDRELVPVQLAKTSAVAQGIDNVMFELGDVYRLPYQDDEFDVVHAHQLLQHLSNPVAALVELRRACRPGGIVAARDADYDAMTWHPADPRLDRWLRLYQAVTRGNDGEPNAGRRLMSWAREAGFREVDASAELADMAAAWRAWAEQHDGWFAVMHGEIIARAR